MAEGMQAGRLEVPVVASVEGFAEKLRVKVEEAAEGLAVKVKVKVDDKGLRKRIEKAVDKAAAGVTATIGVRIDRDRLREELNAAARTASRSDIRVPLRTDSDDGGSSGGGGFLGRIRSWLTRAQGEADDNPVQVPLAFRMPRGRRTMRMLLIGSLVALVQPAVAALGQYAGGLTALVSAAAPAVGVLGAIPGLIAAAGSAAIGTKIAFSGFGDALKESLKAQQMLAADGKVTEEQQEKLDQALGKLSKSAGKAVSAVSALSPAWNKVKKSVSERFFSKIADDVEPLAESVFPLLKDVLGDSADQMGSLAERGAQFMKSSVFRKDFKTIAATSSSVVGNMTDSLANLGHATTDFLVASGPFVKRVGQAIERGTQWARASIQAGRETGSLAKFLDHAGDKAAQLGRSTVSLIKGLGGVGTAAMESGNALLDGFEGSMKRFERWANSGAGQKVMRQFFSDAAPAFHELNALVGDFVRGLGRAMRDGGVTDLIRQIRTELMPALGTFFSALGQSVGPAIISVISNIATAVGNLSAAGSGLGVLLMAFNGLLQIFNTLMNVIPGANTVLAVFLGTLLALKVVSGVATMLRTLGASAVTSAGSMRTLGTTMRGTLGAGVMGPQITMWQRMGLAYRGAAGEARGLGGAMRGLRGANRVASTALGGMTSALGGPLGVAIAGVTIGLGLLASKQEENARAAEAHRERIESLAQALADSGGAIDANVRASAVQLLQDTELADGKGKLVDVMREADVSLKTLTDAYLEQGGSVDGLQKKLLALADANQEYVEKGRDVFVLDYSPQGEKYKAAADALGSVNGELKKSQRDSKEAAEAMNTAGVAGTDAYSRLSAAVQGFSDKTQSADTRVDALKRALDALNGNTQSIHDATAQLNSVMLQIDQTMADTIERSDGWGKSLVDNDGLVNTATRNGQTLNTQLNDLRDSMLGVATRTKEASEQGLMTLAEATDKSQGAMERARAKAIELARDMGIPKDQAAALADQMGFIPDTITTIMTTSGVDKAMAEFLGLQLKLDGLGAGETIRIDAPTTQAVQQLQALGFTVQGLPEGKQVAVTAPTGGARAAIGALAEDISAAPDKKKVTVEAIVKQAAGELKNVQEKVVGLPKGKSIEIKTPTKTARQALEDLGFKIENVDGKNGKTVKITAPSKKPIEQVQSIQDKINNLTGKTVTVTVKYNSEGKPSVVSTHADGGVVRYANGGIHRFGSLASARIKAFANGAEQHIAQIARAGEMRLWAEPETAPGEAYIPLAPKKRKRSEEILDWVASYFGGTVVYPGRAVKQFANGAVALNSAAARTAVAARRASTPQGAGSGALVGGDLNINVGAVGTTANALEEAMFELRRIRLGGSYA
ncbi:hypothetical protein [Streptomyces sp. NPDC001536]|uniref:hypothetical protein n=1 Tax=Streptomyces sp. NPDC001536 TaxID=3364583 RepID=UPI0036840F9F